MNRLAVFHKAKSNYAYPISEDTLRVRLRTAFEDFDDVKIVYGDKYAWHNKKEQRMEEILNDYSYTYYQADLFSGTKRFTYYFKLTKGNKDYIYTECGFSTIVDEDKFKDHFYQFPYINLKDFHKVPEWISGSVWYQIFPERFCNGNPKNNPKNVMPWGTDPQRDNFMGGDLAGIEEKLPYLKDLGINVVYMTPIFYSRSNHKYDIIDYCKIDPHFGTDEEFTKLVKKAHSMGMKVVLDAVFNHCAPDFFAFKDVVKNGKKSKYKDWFFIKEYPVRLEQILKAYKNAKNQDWYIKKGKNIISYETFGFYPLMPKLNTANPEVRDYLVNVGKYWIEKFDIDGWRLDVSNEIDHFFWRRFREEIKNLKHDCLIVGEIWDNGEPWLRGDQFDGVMNYGFTQAVKDFFAYHIISISEFKKRINLVLMRNTDAANESMLNLLDSHDTERLLTTLGEDDDKLIMSLCMLYTFPGNPMIYYGTEIGMTGENDPSCRKCMIWDESEWNFKILSVVKKLINIRKTEPALREGSFSWIYINKDIISFKRTYDRDSIIVILNNTKKKMRYTLPEKGSNVKDLLGSSLGINCIDPNGIKILKISS